MAKLQRQTSGAYTLCLGAKLVKGLGWNKGDEIDVSVGGKNLIELRRVENHEPIRQNTN